MSPAPPDPNSVPPSKGQHPVKDLQTVILADKPPRSLGGNKLLKRVGKGGMGEVWLGIDEKLQRQVAVKMMQQDLLRTTPDAAQRFYQEARAVAKLNHQNIIQIFQIGEEKGLLFFSMEWVDGESLAEYLRREGPLPVATALDIVIQTIDGLAFANSNHVIHRDVKPANIMLDARGRVKITDFGLAKIMDSDTSLTSSGVSMGSPNYMSPEMARGELVDHRADIYAVGITLYQMLTGNVPFSGPSATAVMLKHIQEPLPVPRELEEKAGPSVIDLIRRMTEKNPEHRHQTYAAMRADVAAALEEKRGGARTEDLRTSPKESLVVAANPVVQATIQHPELRKPLGTNKLVLLIAVIGLAVVIVAGVAVVAIKHAGDRDISAPAKTRGNATVGGEIFLKLERGTDAMAGQTVLLFDDVTAERLMIIRNELTAQRNIIDEFTPRLRAQLNEIRATGLSAEKRSELQKQLKARRDRQAKLNSDGIALTSQRDQRRAMVEDLTKKRDDFVERKYATYSYVDPLTGTPYSFTGDESARDNYIRNFGLVIRACTDRLGATQKQLDALTLEHDAVTEEIKSLQLKLNVAERGSAGLGESIADFKSGFKDLVLAHSARNRSLKDLSDPSIKPVAEATTDREGKFQFPEKVKSGRYIVKAFFELRWPTTESRGEERKVVAWLEQVDVSADAPVALKLTQENQLVDASRASLSALEKEYTDQELDENLTVFLGSDYDENLNMAFDRFVKAALGM